MRAVWLKEFGGPEVLVGGDAPDPVTGAGQVLIEVAFANITFVETQFRASGRGPFEPELPMIPGNGVGGVVSAVGEGADTGLIGSQVVTSTGGSGGYAQRVAVEASALFEVPEGLALDAAVALLADGRTATGLVRAAAIKPGERVLVEAAAGGVGSLLVQLAKAAGAEVIGAVAVPARPSWCASLGRTWLSTTGSQTGLSGSEGRSTSCSTASVATWARRRSSCSATAAGCSSSGSPAVLGPRSRTTMRRHAR